MKKAIKQLTIASLALILAACSGNSGPSKPNQTTAKFEAVTTESGFDTRIHFTAYVDKTGTFNTYMDVVKEEFLKYHKLFDKYNNYEGINNIKTINDNAGIAPVEVDPIIIEMLVLSREYYDISHGVFDVTLGAVLKIWHDYREEGELLNANGQDGRIPTNEELAEANKCVGWKFVEIDETKNTVYLNNPCTSLDVGGVAKGFATERVARTLEGMGLQSGIVNAGGNIRLIGAKPNGENWWVGIQNPDGTLDSKSLDSTGYKESMSMVTSGDYQRSYQAGGLRYHHIINPKTLQPERMYRSASIVIKDSGLADILSKVAFLLPYEEARDIIEAQGGEAIWVAEEENAFDAPNSQVIDGFFVAVTDGLVPHTRKIGK